ncbi:uncharacterized protein LOC143918244 isoform X2 [Arctopsyche grandis]
MAASLTDQPLEAQSLDEAKKIIRDLRMRYRAQAHQLLIWRRAHKIQEDLVARVQREKVEQLKSLSSQLLLFESRLIRKQKEITALLGQRETIIIRQQRMIETLNNKLLDNGLEPNHPIVDYRDLINETNLVADFDSLNDSDSAVIMEDVDNDYSLSHVLPRFRSTTTDSVTIVRSISDAIDPNLKYTSVRRSNGFLRRPEILETVYSVEEEPDGDGGSNKLSAQNSTEKDIKEGTSSADKEDAMADMNLAQNRRDNFKMRSEKISSDYLKPCLNRDKSDAKSVDSDISESICQQIAWAYSYVPKRQISNLASSNDNISDCLLLDGGSLLEDCGLERKGNQVTTYNRVMSNHRSVTKPKDVKYKRINKAKSKSLEELRGRLRNWVEKGNKLASISLDQTQSYA